MQQSEIERYLERIRFEGTPNVDYETLKKLHEGHVFHIPFENIDVLHDKTISLQLDDLFQKLVIDQRGGYCFEMNGLFSHVLETLGFQVRHLLARGYRPERGMSTRAHQALLVDADDKQWLCDVGFGGNGLLSPLLFEMGKEQKQYWNEYRVIEEPMINGYAYQCKVDGNFETTYLFNLEDCIPMDYEMSNHYTNTFPTSLFRQVHMLNFPNPKGRVSLFDTTLKIIEDGNETVTEMENETQLHQALKDHFGIVITN